MTQYFKAEPRGYLNKFYTRGGGGGGSALRSNPYPLNTLSYIWQKHYFRIPSINHMLILSCHGFTNGTPFAY